MNTRHPRIPLALLAALVVAGCSAAVDTAPPAPAQPTATPTTAQRERAGYTQGDVRFMQGMIAHHAQALEMTALVPTRTQNVSIQRLAERIEVSQRDEIATMQRWLREHGEEVPGPDAHTGHHGMMPGMLTPEQMTRLAAAAGDQFDRLFLESMILHHQGALVMVDELFATPGAGQQSEVFAFASEVVADQGMEIERMRRVLATLPPAVNHR